MSYEKVSNNVTEERGQAPTDEATDGSLEALIEALTKALATEKERADANMAGWQRAAAEWANYRKRAEQERSELVKNANADLIRRWLSIIDDMERAFQKIPADIAGVPWVEGMRLIERKLMVTLEQEGVTRYDAIGQDFDPAYHDAIAVEETDAEHDGKVVGEILKGYRLRERVLRPAMVRVGKLKGA